MTGFAACSRRSISVITSQLAPRPQSESRDQTVIPSTKPLLRFDTVISGTWNASVVGRYESAATGR